MERPHKHARFGCALIDALPDELLALVFRWFAQFAAMSLPEASAASAGPSGSDLRPLPSSAPASVACVCRRWRAITSTRAHRVIAFQTCFGWHPETPVRNWVGEIWRLFCFRFLTLCMSRDDALLVPRVRCDAARTRVVDMGENAVHDAFLRFVAWNAGSEVRVFEDFPRMRSFFDDLVSARRFIHRGATDEHSVTCFEFMNGCRVRLLPTMAADDDDEPYASDLDVLNRRTLNEENLQHACALKRARVTSPLVVIVGCASADFEWERQHICADEATRRDWEFLFGDEKGDSRPTVIVRLSIGEPITFTV